jgi:anti-sigma-K factor RskA
VTEDEFALLAAGAALGALSEDDQRTYRRALEDHPEWVSSADEDAETAALLAELPREVAPPPALRDQLLASIDEAAAETANDAEPDASAYPAASRPAKRGWGRRGWFALAASLVLVAGIGTATVITMEHNAQPVAVVALDRIQSAPDAQHASAHVEGGGQATLHWSESLGQAVLVAEDMPRVSADHTYELWYVRDETAIPAGTFDARGNSTSAVLKPGMQPGDVIAVTVEQSGGSPTGQPTSDPILTIPTS